MLAMHFLDPAHVQPRDGRREERDTANSALQTKPTEGFEPSTPALRERFGVSRSVRARSAQAHVCSGLPAFHRVAPICRRPGWTPACTG
jgi:DNA-binding transcriptional MocR family regulator